MRIMTPTMFFFNKSMCQATPRLKAGNLVPDALLSWGRAVYGPSVIGLHSQRLLPLRSRVRQARRRRRCLRSQAERLPPLGQPRGLVPSRQTLRLSRWRCQRSQIDQ